jgi:hypothetical protein
VLLDRLSNSSVLSPPLSPHRLDLLSRNLSLGFSRACETIAKPTFPVMRWLRHWRLTRQNAFHGSNSGTKRDLMVKAGWGKQPSRSVKGFGVDWTDCGKLAMQALGHMIEDLGPENLNQQLWWAVGTLANMEFTSPS